MRAGKCLLKKGYEADGLDSLTKVLRAPPEPLSTHTAPCVLPRKGVLLVVRGSRGSRHTPSTMAQGRHVFVSAQAVELEPENVR